MEMDKRFAIISKDSMSWMMVLPGLIKKSMKHYMKSLTMGYTMAKLASNR